MASGSVPVDRLGKDAPSRSVSISIRTTSSPTGPIIGQRQLTAGCSSRLPRQRCLPERPGHAPDNWINPDENPQ
jgi:hypothetical protein